MDEAAVRAPQRSLWREIGEDIGPSAKAMLGDAALFLLGLIILAVSFVGLVGLKALQYPPKYIDTLEALHFWGYFSVLAVLLLDLLLKIASHSLRRR
jgi:hypothetical protein